MNIYSLEHYMLVASAAMLGSATGCVVGFIGYESAPRSRGSKPRISGNPAPR